MKRRDVAYFLSEERILRPSNLANPTQAGHDADQVDAIGKGRLVPFFHR
jgi:hypothetical protein